MTVARTVLDNGVTVLSERIPHLQSVTLGFWVPAGSRAEMRPDSGIAHFIEHMLFKGTGRRSALDISREIESVGGTMNAYTEREHVFFFVKALEKDFSRAAGLLADIYIDSRFDAGELERERDVILQEILMVEDSPEETLHDFFHESYWGEHPLGYPIQGTADTVATFTRDRVAAYFGDMFRRRGIVVSVVGNLPHARVEEEFSRLLAPLRLGNPFVPEPSPQPGRGVRTRERPFEQLHVCIGAPGVSRGSEDRYVAHVLNAILGGSMSSRLFQEIREKRGLAYSVYSSLSAYADSGILEICAGTTRAKAREVLAVTADVVAKMHAGRIEDAEVDLARELIKGNMILSLESPEYRMSRLAMNEMALGRHETPEEALRELDAVSPDRVRKLAAGMLAHGRFMIAAVGDLPDDRDLAF